MHVDSRNPQIFIPKLIVTDKNNLQYATSQQLMWNEYQGAYDAVEAKMLPAKDLCGLYSDEPYATLQSYQQLKAKLENLERKHAKLKRRHDTLGQKYVILNQGFEGLLYRVKIMEGL